MSSVVFEVVVVLPSTAFLKLLKVAPKGSSTSRVQRGCKACGRASGGLAAALLRTACAERGMPGTGLAASSCSSATTLDHEV